MTREEAEKRLARARLARLSPVDRAEQLEVMTLEGWSDAPGWKALNPEVRAELENGALEHPATDERYDPVLLLWLRSQLGGSTNAYLEAGLREEGLFTTPVVGPEPRLEACPCCGLATLGERSSYEICRVCWWEDDGQDNAKADTVLGGPNYHLSLTQARANFLRHGISDPAREDLLAHRDPVEKYARAREFALSSGGDELIEKGTSWTSRAFKL